MATRKGYRVTITDRGSRKKVMDFNVTPAKARKLKARKKRKPSQKAQPGLGGFKLNTNWLE